MLLGYAVGSNSGNNWREIEPYDEIGGLDAALLGPLVQLFDRLEATWRALREPATVTNWCVRLRALLSDFFAPEDKDDAYTMLQLDAALQRWQQACIDAGLKEELPLSVVAEYWMSQLDAGGLTQHFFAGAVTFATLMPMRAIPFRHVCLLGMSDGEYPRTRVPMDFDLMGRDYRPGDRSRREDDRYLFLEALLSARDCLHISWVGRSINDNTPRPPSVLVCQLRDHLAAGWKSIENAGVMDLLAALTVEHRLQPFNPEYFSTPADPLFTYASEWRANAGSLNDPGLHPLLLPIVPEDPLSLQDLASFLKDPVKVFFQQRLNVYFQRDDPASEDQEPFGLDGLGHWKLQNELIQAQLDALTQGEDMAVACSASLARIQGRGELAAGGFGEVMANRLTAPMDELFLRHETALQRWSLQQEAEEEIRFEAEIEGQWLQLADWIGGIRFDDEGRRGRVVLETSDLVKDKHYRGEKMIGHWITHLALHLAGVPLTTVVVGKVGTIELKPVALDEAQAWLTQLLSAWQHGMRRPLPLPPKTAFAWLKTAAKQSPYAEPDLGQTNDDGLDAAHRALPDKAMNAARKVYEGGYQQTGEVDNSVYFQRAFPDFDALVASGEFTKLAELLLHPLLRAMPVDGHKSAEPATSGAAA